MSTPVNNNPNSTGAGGAPVTGNDGVKLTAKANLNLGNGNNAIHQLNGRIGNDSQNTLPNTNNNALHNARDGHNADAPVTQGNNGNHYGQLKHGNNGNQGQTPPFNPGTANPQPNGKGQTGNTPPFNPGTPNQFPTTNPQTPRWNPPIIIISTRIYNPSSPNGVLRNAVVDILRQNDIYLSRNIVNQLIGNQNSNGNNISQNIPAEVRQLVQTIVNQLSNPLNNSTPPNQQYIRQLANDISNQLNSVRNMLVYINQPDAKHFSHLNIQERVFLAIELMFRHLPPNTNLSQLSNTEIYQGLMLARGLVSSNENTADIRNLVSYRSDVLPVNFSATALRDLGQLVKVLVTDAANAKTTANLDLAVQKFIRILVANNELGVLLAAAALAKQAELGTISANRTLALVQIYQLISRLIQAGEAAIREAAAKNGLVKNDSIGVGLNKFSNAEEKNALLRDLQTNNLHNNLKNFLEFNPAFVAERSVSSFINADDARHAQQHFSAYHTDEIEQWLDSGNHRFVKEIDLEKPVGIVVERGAEDFFTASKARIVLVRDSSAQGWHFFKSFLVT